MLSDSLLENVSTDDLMCTQKCFISGRNFPPRDVQQRIEAYNAKYGDFPIYDTSSEPDQAYHALQPINHQLPSKNISTTNLSTTLSLTLTISQLNHTLPTPTIKELLHRELGTHNATHYTTHLKY